MTTLAGLAGNSGTNDGTGSAARFFDPYGLAVDGAGNVYVADTFNSTVRKITPAGVVTTLAGVGGSEGNVDGTGTSALFNEPASVTVDSATNVYVADQYNDTIRVITPAGVVTTVAGVAVSAGSANGTGTEARFDAPYAVATATNGDVYVADTDNSTIRKINTAGVASTIAGLAGNNGSADGAGSEARFNNPRGVAVDSAGNVYVADYASSTIRKVTPAGVVTTLAGLAGFNASNDGTGNAARFYYPYGVAVDNSGNIYVGDYANNTIRKVTPAGVVTTLAGTAGKYGTNDGIGTEAQFSGPEGLAVDSAGNVYVADSGNSTIRMVTPTGVVTTLAGTAAILAPTTGREPRRSLRVLAAWRWTARPTFMCRTHTTARSEKSRRLAQIGWSAPSLEMRMRLIDIASRTGPVFRCDFILRQEWQWTARAMCMLPTPRTTPSAKASIRRTHQLSQRLSRNPPTLGHWWSLLSLPKPTANGDFHGNYPGATAAKPPIILSRANTPSSFATCRVT